jgi:hypothetical protein
MIPFDGKSILINLLVKCNYSIPHEGHAIGQIYINKSNDGGKNVE